MNVVVSESLGPPPPQNFLNNLKSSMVMRTARFVTKRTTPNKVLHLKPKRSTRRPAMVGPKKLPKWNAEYQRAEILRLFSDMACLAKKYIGRVHLHEYL